MSAPGPVEEKAAWHPGPNGPIFTASFAPPGGAAKTMLLCPPFGEELKSGARTLAALGRVLAGRGLRAVYLDYAGTGDSAGDERRFTVGTAVADVVSLLETLPAGRRGLLGLRLGAALALLAHGERAADCLVLWAPVVDGAEYLKTLRRRRSFRASLPGGPAGEAAPADLDLEGFLLGAGGQESLAALARDKLQAPLPAATLAVQVSHRRQPDSSLEWLERGGAAVVACCLEPFWDRVGAVDTGGLVTQTAAWVGERWPP